MSDGAIADYEQARQLPAANSASTEDDLLVRLRLAALRLRLGDFDAAKAEIARATGQSRRAAGRSGTDPDLPTRR